MKIRSQYVLNIFLFSHLLLLNNLNATQISAQYMDNENNSVTKEKQIIGISEPVTIHPGNIQTQAKIDTGAQTTSLDAQDLKIVNEDGVDWAIFSFNGELQKHQIINYVMIKQHNVESHTRPVIQLHVTLGNISQTVNVTLTNRGNFKYRMLIGVNFLYDHFIVDVSQNNLSKPLVLAYK